MNNITEFFSVRRRGLVRKEENTMQKLNQKKLIKTLQERLTREMEECRVSAAHLLVLQEGQEVCSIRVGYQDWDTKEPLREDAIYRLASMTKPVTGVAALIAEEKGYFKITDKLEDHMPQFRDMRIALEENGEIVAGESNTVPLRIWHLLTHCNGLTADTPIGNRLADSIPASAYRSLETAVDYVSTLPLAFTPESFSAYTGRLSFDVVARLIEIKSGMSYAQFLQENIFDPLGLKDFTYSPTDDQWDRMLTLTDRAAGPGFVTTNLGKHIFEGFPLTYTCAGAGLAASMADYAVFAEMLQNRGTYHGIQILSPERFQELVTPYVPPQTPGRNPISSWGLGVQLIDQESVLPVGTFGWSGAYGTHFWVDPVNKITAIYMRGSRWYDSHGCGMIGLQFEKDVVSCLEG